MQTDTRAALANYMSLVVNVLLLLRRADEGLRARLERVHARVVPNHAHEVDATEAADAECRHHVQVVELQVFDAFLVGHHFVDEPANRSKGAIVVMLFSKHAIQSAHS